MDNDSEYLVRSPKQIASHLTFLYKRNCLLSAYFGANRDSFITTILTIDPKKNLLVMDYGPKEYLNKQLLNSGRVEFHTEFDGIKVSFNCEKISKERISGHTAFSMPIPHSMFWRQRRKFYRIKIPLTHDSYCDISFVNDKNETKTDSRFKLTDLSISGFCFVNENLEFSKDLIPTAEFERCTLHLHDGAEETVSFTVRNKSNVNPNKPDKGQRIGCAFTEISPAGESNIQRYMQNIEREMKNIL